MRMTNEQFSHRYHLLDRLSQGPVVTHHAQSANGAMVMVHSLRGTPDENAAVIAKLDALTPERRARILTVVDVDGVTTIVTKFVLDFTSLQDWLATGATQLPPPLPDSHTAPVSPAAPLIAPSVPPISPSRAPAGPPPFSSNAPAGSGPGEFTQLFQSAEPPAAAQQAVVSTPLAPPSSPAGGADPKPVASPPSSSGDPGEFTLLFRGTPPATSPPVIDARLAPSPPPPAASVQPIRPAPSIPLPRGQSGEFTRMFGAPMPKVAPPVQEPPAAQSPVQAPSFFGEPAPPAPTPFEMPTPPSPPAEPIDPTLGAAWRGFATPTPQSEPPAAGPGEYTRLFGGPPAPPLMVPAQSRLPSGSPTPSIDWGSPGASGSTMGSSAGDAYFDRLVGGTTPAPVAAPGFPAAPQNIPPALPAFSGPSEFTRIISGSPLSPMLTPPPARPIVPPPPVTPLGDARKGGDRVLLFSLVGVIVLAIVLVAVFLIVT